MSSIADYLVLSEKWVVIYMELTNVLDYTCAVFRVLYTLKCRNISWKVDGSEPVPVRLKFMKGFPGLNNDNQLFFTVESFISEGMADSPGKRLIMSTYKGLDGREVRKGVVYISFRCSIRSWRRSGCISSLSHSGGELKTLLLMNIRLIPL